MNGLWKEQLSGWNTKDSRRKKQTRKNTLRDKSRAILQDFYKTERNSKHFTRIENEQTITYTGSRWGIEGTLPKYADIVKIGFRIPHKGDEYDTDKGSFVTMKAYHQGGPYNGAWKEIDTDKTIREYFDLNFTQKMLIADRDIVIGEKCGKKLLDWTDELEKRKKVTVRDFTHSTQRDFVYDKPLLSHLKWSMYTESGRRKFAHKYVQGQTRASVRNWIQKGDWDTERQIPWGEISYAWIIS